MVSSAIVSLRLRVGSRALTTPAIVGVGAVAGVGFTVSLLISSLAFRGQALQEAKVGVLISALAATALSWLVFRLIARLPKATRARQMAGTLEEIMDLSEDVDPERDHIRGGHGAPVTLVEYGDYEWPLLWPGRACRPRTAPLVWRRPSLRVAPPAPSRGASPRADWCHSVAENAPTMPTVKPLSIVNRFIDVPGAGPDADVLGRAPALRACRRPPALPSGYR